MIPTAKNDEVIANAEMIRIEAFVARFRYAATTTTSRSAAGATAAAKSSESSNRQISTRNVVTPVQTTVTNGVCDRSRAETLPDGPGGDCGIE